jgi:hypothetical protein
LIALSSWKDEVHISYRLLCLLTSSLAFWRFFVEERK